MPTPIWSVEWNGEKLVFDRPAEFKAYMQAAKRGRYELTVRKQVNRRGSPANRYYWGVVLEIFAHFLGCEKEVLHQKLKERIVPTGEPNALGIIPTESTAGMDSARFAWFVETVRMTAAEMGCVIPGPNEVEWVH